MAVSLVIGSKLATPRTPSVPNSLRMVLPLSALRCLEENRLDHPHHVAHGPHIVPQDEAGACFGDDLPHQVIEPKGADVIDDSSAGVKRSLGHSGLRRVN